MYLIDADKTEWFQIKCTDGNTYVLIKKKHLFDLPKVDAELVKHGEWGASEIVGYDGLHVVYAVPCSVCGKHTREFRARYCPNCGAKMDGKDK